MIEHPSPQALAELVNGMLPAAETEVIFVHLDGCDACQVRVESLLPPDGLPDVDADIPTMTVETSWEIENRLLCRIRTAAVGNEVAWLVTTGFLSAVCFLLRPLLAFDNVGESTRGTTR